MNFRNKKKRLWRSPLGARWVVTLVLILLIATFIKFITPCPVLIRKYFYFSESHKSVLYDLFDLILYGCWLIIPPVFFLIEYVFIFDKDETRRMDEDQLSDMKYVQDLASKVWAAVGVFFSIMLLLKYGIRI
jgi:hypothetical protein